MLIVVGDVFGVENVCDFVFDDLGKGLVEEVCG